MAPVEAASGKCGLNIAVFEHTAVATMVCKAEGTDEKGKPMDANALWTDTWAKMPNGACQCILSQGSNLKLNIVSYL